MTSNFAKQLLDKCDITPPDKPNYALAFPRGYCQLQASAFSPVYAINQQQLLEKIVDVIKHLPRHKDLNIDKDKLIIKFTQYSAVFHFPDKIEIRVLNTGPAESSVLIYSHSVYGYYDFGVNKRRVLALLASIKTEVS